MNQMIKGGTQEAGGTSSVRRGIVINVAILLAAALVLALFDMSLELGQFQGAVFALYLLYSCGIQLVVNLAVAAILWMRNKRDAARGAAIGGLVVPVTGAALLYIGVRLAGS